MADKIGWRITINVQLSAQGERQRSASFRIVFSCIAGAATEIILYGLSGNVYSLFRTERNPQKLDPKSIVSGLRCVLEWCIKSQDVDLVRIEIPDGGDSVRGASCRRGKSGRSAAADLLPDR